MNERIKEFINRATVVSYDELFNLETSRFDREKFAELIVRERAMVGYKSKKLMNLSRKVKNHKIISLLT